MIKIYPKSALNQIAAAFDNITAVDNKKDADVIVLFVQQCKQSEQIAISLIEKRLKAHCPILFVYSDKEVMEDGEFILNEHSKALKLTGLIAFTRTCLAVNVIKILPAVLAAWEDFIQEEDVDEALWVLSGRMLEPGELNSCNN